MKKMQVYLTLFLSFLSALLLAGVFYLTFIFPKTVKLWEDEGRAISVVENLLVNLSNLCTSLGIIIIPMLFLAVIGFAVWGILAGIGNKKESADNLNKTNNNESNSIKEDKKEILEMLARKEISKEEAEKKLQELGGPLPESQPSQPVSNSSKGCLIAIIIALVVLPFFALLAFALLFVA